jgi:hypothetical protein
MELFESHFNNLTGNLYYDKENDTYDMFSYKGCSKHINYLTFKELFKNMKDLKEPIILESGIASQGTQSTYLFNEVVKKYGGRFWSVDINPYLIENNKGNMCPATQLVCNDSVSFFKEWSNNNKEANVIYLDSYDLDFYNPEPSGLHGLSEYKALLPVIKKNTLLLIDDTPKNPYWLDTRGKIFDDMSLFYKKNNFLPGKGMYILNEVNNAKKIIHNYQVLYHFFDTPDWQRWSLDNHDKKIQDNILQY